MTENLMQKIEEKVLALLNELDSMRTEVIKLRSENAILREDQGTHVQKLQGLITLLDVLESSDHRPAINQGVHPHAEEEFI